MARTARNGFTLFEVVIALSILAVMLALPAINLKRRHQQLSSAGAAQILAEALQSERLKAMSGQPRALVFSTSNGSTALTRSAGLLSGFDQPVSEGVVQLTQNDANLVVYVGPPSGNGILPPVVFLEGGAFEPSNWLPPDFHQEMTLIFLPNGAVTSRGIPLDQDGAFKFVCAQQAQLGQGTTLTWGGEADPPSFSLERASAPFTVAITPAGSMSVTPGAPGVHLGGDMPAPLVSGAPPALLRGSGGSAEFADLNIFPVPEGGDIGGSTTATLTADDYLLLTTTALHSDGRDLIVRWSVEPHSSNLSQGEGSYSDHFRRMDFDLVALLKEHSIAWRPPHDAVGGDRYTLTVELDDGNGQVTRSTEAMLDEVVIVERGKLMLLQFELGMRVMNLDGSNPRSVPGLGALEPGTGVSADGQRIVSTAKHPAETEPGTLKLLRTLYSDGTEVARIGVAENLQIQAPGIAPGGERVSFLARRLDRPSKSIQDPYFLYTANFDGSDVQPVIDQDTGDPINAGMPHTRANILLAHNDDGFYGDPLNPGQGTFGKANNSTAWSPDGNVILFPKTIGTWDHAATGIARCTLTGPNIGTVDWLKAPVPGADLEDNYDYYFPAWGFGDKICYTEEHGIGTHGVVYDINTGVETVLTAPIQVAFLAPSPASADEIFINAFDVAGGYTRVYRMRGLGAPQLILDDGNHVHTMIVAR